MGNTEATVPTTRSYEEVLVSMVRLTTLMKVYSALKGQDEARRIVAGMIDEPEAK